MGIFGHVSVFVAIILGLAVAHLLGGLSLILDTRHKTRVYWVHLLWTVAMLLTASLFWMNSFALASAETLSILYFLTLVAYAMAIYLMSGLLYPVLGDEVTDFREHFEANRLRFYALGLVLIVIDVIDAVLEHYATDLDWDLGQLFAVTALTGLYLLAMRMQSSRVDAFVAVFNLFMVFGWLASLIDYGVLV